MAWVEKINNNKININSENSWTWPPAERGKLNCILCQKVITFASGSTNEFFDHVENDHHIFIDHDLLLSIIFLDNETLDEIRQNLNTLKVTESQDFEETVVDDCKDSHDDRIFGEDHYGFDEDEMFHDFTKSFNNDNEKDTSFTPKEDFLNKQIKEDLALEKVNVAKYKPGPKSYKIKQLYKINKDRMLYRHNDEKSKTSLKSNSNLEGTNFDQHIPWDSKIINEVLDTPFRKPSNYVKINDTESVQPKSPEINLDSPGQNDQFKSDDTKKTFNTPQDDNIHYKPGPKSRKNKLKLKVNNEILKNRENIEDDVNMSKKLPKEDFFNNLVNCGEGEGIHDRKIDNGVIKLDNLYLSGSKRKSYNPELVESYKLKRKKVEEPKTNTATSMMGEVKHMLKSYAFDKDLGCEMQGESKPNCTSERLVKSSVEEQIKSILECDEFGGDNTFENREMENSVQITANQQLEDEIKSILYFDTLNKATDKTKLNEALYQDHHSFKDESYVLNGPHLEDINPKKPVLTCVSIPPKLEKGDSEHTKPSESGRKYPINVEVSEYFNKRPKQLSGYNIAENVKNQFVNDLSLPDGWKVRRIWRHTKKNYETDYLSPDGRKARSKVAVIEYMKLLGIYCKQDYDKIIENYDINLYKIIP